MLDFDITFRLTSLSCLGFGVVSVHCEHRATRRARNPKPLVSTSLRAPREGAPMLERRDFTCAKSRVAKSDSRCLSVLQLRVCPSACPTCLAARGATLSRALELEDRVADV